MSMPSRDIGDRNVERLLCDAYRPETIDPAFALETLKMLQAAAHEMAASKPVAPPRTPTRPERDFLFSVHCALLVSLLTRSRSASIAASLSPTAWPARSAQRI